MNFKKIALLASVILLQSCATRAPLAKVPTLSCEEFDGLEATSVQMRYVSIDVKNLKKVNQTAGNAGQVAGKISDLLQCIAEKGGFKVGPSPNKWTLTIEDCEPSTNPKEIRSKSPSAVQPEKTSCVKMKSDFMTPDFKYFGESSASQGYAFGDPHYILNGKMDEAYRDALHGIVRRMNEKLK
ncbi:MAG: hypothetical protein H7333_02720 [Bdellovibrionales bacterium]|nr:hypothetical protein [Oligoflexia bacterium]